MPQEDLLKLINALSSIGCQVISFNYNDIHHVIELELYYRPDAPKEKASIPDIT